MTTKRFILINPHLLENDQEREKFSLKESLIDKFKSIINNENLSSIEIMKLLKLTMEEEEKSTVFETSKNNPESNKDFSYPLLNENENSNKHINSHVIEQNESDNSLDDRFNGNFSNMSSNIFDNDTEQMRHQEEENEINAIDDSPPVKRIKISDLSADKIKQIKDGQLYNKLKRNTNINWNDLTGTDVEFSNKKIKNISIFKLIYDIENSIPLYQELIDFYTYLSKNKLKDYNKNIFMIAKLTWKKRKNEKARQN